jgi:SagB-type dehydrogenase family enzyme
VRNKNLRTVPSAGALYPLEIYLIKTDGCFRYSPQTHAVELIHDQDLRFALAQAAFHQSFIAGAPVVIVITGVFERVTSQYGTRGKQYVFIEVGHAAQNVHLVAVSLGLASVPVGAFNDSEVAKVLRLPSDHRPLYIIPVGAAG